MVAISLYRGNQHRVPDVPRPWLMPTPKISLKDFKILLHRRSKALSRLHSTTIAAATTSNPNHPNIKQEQEQETDEDKSNVHPLQKPQLELDPPPTKVEDFEEGAPKDQKGSDDGDFPLKPIDDLQISVDVKLVLPEINSNLVEPLGNSLDEIKIVSLNPSTESESTNKEVALNDKEGRKSEVYEKLQVLSTRKHNLVQVLKQILNAEEELKR